MKLFYYQILCYIILNYIKLFFTSSTAQGGGGSFKHRKPIGEVGCCESGMAERSHWWTDRWLRSPLFLSLFLSFSDYLPTYLPACLPTYLPTYRSIYLSIYLSVYLSIYLSLSLFLSSVYLTIYLSIYRSIYRSIHPSIHLSISLSVCLSIYLPVYLQAWKPSYSARLLHFSKLTTSKTQHFCETSSFFKVDNIKNEAILRDFLNVCTWQRQKRSKSARLPHISKLTTSKTKQFCETSSFFELDNIQNEATLRDFFNFWTWQHQKRSNSARRPSKMESWLQRWRPRTNAFRDFSTPPV